MDLLVCGSPVLVGVVLPLFWYRLLLLVVCTASILLLPLVASIHLRSVVSIQAVASSSGADLCVVPVLVLALLWWVSPVLVA